MCVVDGADYDDLMQYKWYASYPKRRLKPYVVRYQNVGGRSRNISIHRHIMNPPDGMVVDHINGDPLDNRRANLRVVSVSDNNHNCAVKADRRGVYMPKGRQHYMVRFNFQNKAVSAYGFKTEEDGAKFYDELCVLLRGVGSAVTNFDRPDALRIHSPTLDPTATALTERLKAAVVIADHILHGTFITDEEIAAWQKARGP
jgi:hypothetical protein